MAPSRKNHKGGSANEVELESCPFKRLLYWRDPPKSGGVFGAGLAVLFAITKCSLISVIAWTLLAAVCGALGFYVYKFVMAKVNKEAAEAGDGHPFQELLDAPLPEALSDTQRAREFGESLFATTLSSVKKFRALVLVEDVVESLKFIVVLWLATYVGAWFNGLSLVILSWIGLFTLPRVYLEYKTEIDEQLEKVTSLLGQVRSKIPGQAATGKDD